MDRGCVKKRPRGRPRTAGNVVIFPIHRKPDISEVSRAFIELGLHFSRERVKIGSKGSERAGLKRQRKVEWDYHG